MLEREIRAQADHDEEVERDAQPDDGEEVELDAQADDDEGIERDSEILRPSRFSKSGAYDFQFILSIYPPSPLLPRPI